MNRDATLPLPNYRRASERWPQAPALLQYHEAISSCIAGNGHGVVDPITMSLNESTIDDDALGGFVQLDYAASKDCATANVRHLAR